jgi:hypothetical protein
MITAIMVFENDSCLVKTYDVQAVIDKVEAEFITKDPDGYIEDSVIVSEAIGDITNDLRKLLREDHKLPTLP